MNNQRVVNSPKQVRACILDYGSGNAKSVYNLFTCMQFGVVISNRCADIKKCTHIVLPGVGSFGSTMKKVKENIPIDIVENEVVNLQKPFLGICVGMQILSEKGYEFQEHTGLGWISGEVRKLETHGKPLPHIGWNDIRVKTPTTFLDGIATGNDFYFSHSYVTMVKEQDCVIAETEYGNWFTSIVQKHNIFGVQFHPEKSQKYGQQLIRNFLAIT